MYPRYNIPQNKRPMQNNQNYFTNNGDRFIGGGFIAPFLLGGIAGSLVNRPYYNNPPIIYYPPPYRPYYNNNNYYYY